VRRPTNRPRGPGGSTTTAAIERLSAAASAIVLATATSSPAGRDVLLVRIPSAAAVAHGLTSPRVMQPTFSPAGPNPVHRAPGIFQ
jgi:hypothetical protein